MTMEGSKSSLPPTWPGIESKARPSLVTSTIPQLNSPQRIAHLMMKQQIWSKNLLRLLVEDPLLSGVFRLTQLHGGLICQLLVHEDMRFCIRYGLISRLHLQASL